MSTLAEIRALVVINIGGRNDADAVAVIDAGINYAVTLAALMFEPVEMEESDDIDITGGSSSASLSQITNLLDIITIANTTDGIPMFFIPYEQWDMIVPASVGAVKYYSMWGDALYVKDTPSVNKSLKVHYRSFPALLTSDSSDIPFDNYDSFIVSTTSALVMAAFEEAESAQMWQTLAQASAAPIQLGQRAQAIIAGKQKLFESIAGGGK